MENIKRNVKLTKINEMEAEVKVYGDEMQRLKVLLHKTIGIHKLEAS